MGVRWPTVLGAIGLALVLAGCGLGLFSVRLPKPLPSEPLYTGSDAVQLTMRTTQVGCCYMEGSRRYASLDGPLSIEWAVTGRGNSPRPDSTGSFVQHLALMPGHYTLSVWERVCSGTCGGDYEGPPTGKCSTEIDVVAGQALNVQVTFPISETCSIQVQGG